MVADSIIYETPTIWWQVSLDSRISQESQTSVPWAFIALIPEFASLAARVLIRLFINPLSPVEDQRIASASLSMSIVHAMSLGPIALS